MLRLKELRLEKNQNMRQTAIALGIPYTTYISYEKGDREPNSEMLIALAEYFDCSIDYLLGKTSTKELLKKLPAEEYHPETMIPIPVVGKVAAGYTCLAEMDIECYELVDSESILHGYDYIWLAVKGDSMEPFILEGDLVLVRIQDTVNNGDYAVVLVDSEDGLVKQVKFGKNKITLLSTNPYYPPRVFENENIQRVRIVGKVIESKRKF